MALNKICMALAAALFLSLSVNFFLAGLMLGDALTSSPPPVAVEDKSAPEDPRRAEWKKREEALRAALSTEDQTVLQQSTEAHKEKFDTMKVALDAARQDVASAMMAEPFDQAALDTAIEAETEMKSQFMREMFQARRDVMQELSPEGRKTFQEMNPMRRRGGHRPAPEGRDDMARDRPSPRTEGGERQEMRRLRRDRLERLQERRALPERATPLPPGSPRPEEKNPPAALP